MISLLVCVLLSLVTTGLCLECIQCTNNNSSFCSGQEENCTVGELCVSIITQMTAAAGQKTQVFERGCGDAKYCNISASMSSFISTNTNRMCCSTDSCTPPAPTLINGSKVQNHIQCPVCLAHDTKHCSNPNVRNCTGDERYCIEYKETSDNERTIILGCATKSFCYTAPSQKLVDGKIIAAEAKCVKGGSGHLRYQSVLLHVLLLGQVTIALQPL
ncbi:phospholipase A2 inhibitor NAI-like [Mixophyes fleayi]|uniref:phospholipase A2 inhibitor NAI-like n=1 Tax=Mixophyes fleayi TaxID=3061075 RepID=UPI003F4DBA69